MRLRKKMSEKAVKLRHCNNTYLTSLFISRTSINHVSYEENQLKVCRFRQSVLVPITNQLSSSIPDLRTAVDDNLPASLAQLGYTQSFSLIDLKIALGYTTVLIAAGLFLVDKKYGFESIFNITIAAILVYALASVVLYYFSSVGEYKNNKYIGYNEKGEKILVASWTMKHKPIYHIKIALDNKEEITAELDFTKVFDGWGYYKQDETTEFLKGVIEKKLI